MLKLNKSLFTSFEFNIVLMKKEKTWKKHFFSSQKLMLYGYVLTCVLIKI